MRFFPLQHLVIAGLYDLGGTQFRVPHLMSTGLYDQDGTQFRDAVRSCTTKLSFGCCVLNRRVELSSGGFCFLLPGRNSVPPSHF